MRLAGQEFYMRVNQEVARFHNLNRFEERPYFDDHCGETVPVYLILEVFLSPIRPPVIGWSELAFLDATSTTIGLPISSNKIQIGMQPLHLLTSLNFQRNKYQLILLSLGEQ